MDCNTNEPDHRSSRFAARGVGQRAAWHPLAVPSASIELRIVRADRGAVNPSACRAERRRLGDMRAGGHNDRQQGARTMRTISWGVVGCGDVCERKSGPPLYQVPGSRLVAVMRRTRDKAADFAARHGVPRFYDRLGDLLADRDVEAVYVATPDGTHLEPVLAALAAGKHVLCEKPMAANRAECRRMIDAAAERRVVLAVAYYRRCYPSILRARELLADGAIGRVRRLWINDEFPESHRLDLVHFFCGDVAEAWATTEKLPLGNSAAVGPVLHCLGAEGVESCTHLGWQEKLAPEVLDFTGDGGRLVVEDLKAGKLLLDRGGRRERLDVGPLRWTHWGLVANFVQHLNGLVPLACSGVEGRKSTAILDVVESLGRDGTRVKPDYS